jgi:hypothetical protein
MPDLKQARDRITHLAQEKTPFLSSEPAEASSPLPIRATPSKVVKLWDKAANREAVLDGIPGVTDATLSRGESQGDWGTTFRINLTLESAVPGTATRVFAGKAIRRLKALAETGEIPTTDRNPSYRADAGEESSS